MSLWCTATTAGLEIGKSSDTSSTSHVHCRSSNNNNKCKMSQIGDDLHHTPRYLSWRKLQLSRAKLKASSKTSALLSGFAMVAMVEVQLQTPTTIPSAVLVTFAVITTLLVAVHMLALMISTCILPNIEAICSMDAIHLVEESPHEKLHWYIETAWAFSTLLGLLLFLAEIAVLCWVKFYEIDKTAAWSACIILIPVLFVFLAFAVHFYRSLVSHKYEMTVSGIRELEMLKEQIELGDADHNRGNGLGDIMTGNPLKDISVDIVFLCCICGTIGITIVYDNESRSEHKHWLRSTLFSSVFGSLFLFVLLMFIVVVLKLLYLRRRY